MKPSTKAKAKGQIHEVKGKVKEKFGRLTNDRELEAEGEGEKLGGKMLKKIAKAEKAVGL